MYPSFPERFNMADYFLYHNLEEGRESKICLYYEDRQWTYGDVARLSNRTGKALRELGADLEDRVLMVLPDCPEFVWTWFGAARVGAVITMVNPLLPAATIDGLSGSTSNPLMPRPCSHACRNRTPTFR